MIHGLRYLADDFTPRPVFYALENTDALFSDTKLDPSIGTTSSGIPALRRQSRAQFLAYGLQSRAGKAIIAYWLAAHSLPGNVFPPLTASLTIKNTGIENPVLVDVVSGEISPLEWKKGTKDTLESVPVRDSVLAIADESYFDWPVLPEAPSSLKVHTDGGSVRLTWGVHGGDPKSIVVERRTGDRGTWEKVATLPATQAEYTDSRADRDQVTFYRVRAANGAGESAYSNIAKTSF